MTTHDARLSGWNRSHTLPISVSRTARAESTPAPCTGALLAALSRGGAAIGCVTGWIAFVCVFVCAVAVATVVVGGLAAVLAAAFLTP